MEDGIDALMPIIGTRAAAPTARSSTSATRHNEASVKELAELLRDLFRRHPDHADDGAYSKIVETRSGLLRQGLPGYPDPEALCRQGPELLGWEPRTDLRLPCPSRWMPFWRRPGGKAVAEKIDEYRASHTARH